MKTLSVLVWTQERPRPKEAGLAAWEPSRRALWVCRGLCAFLVVAIALALGRVNGYAGSDIQLVFVPARAIASGHFSHAYLRDPPVVLTPGRAAFQPPGFPLLAGGIMFVLGHLVGVSARDGLEFANYGTVVTVIAGGTMLLRALGVRRNWELVFLAGLVVDPFFSYALAEEFHPQDVLAVGLTLSGLAFAVRGRWVWAGMLLGVAIACKQTALLALIPLVFAAPGNRKRLETAGSAVMGSTIVFGPLCLLNWESARYILQGPPSGGLANGIISHLNLPIGFNGQIVRGGPIIASVVISAAVYISCRRAARRATCRSAPNISLVPPAALLGAITGCAAVRVVFEATTLSYYLLPASVVLVILAAYRKRPGLVAIWLIAATYWFSTPLAFGAMGSWAAAVIYAAFGISAIGLALPAIMPRTPEGLLRRS